MQKSATLLLSELSEMGPVIEPMRDGTRLCAIGMTSKDDRPIVEFTYQDGRTAKLGVGGGEYGVVAFVKDDVVVAFARLGRDQASALGIDPDSRRSLAAAGLRTVTCIERMKTADLAQCVGPIVDVDALDLVTRYDGIVPSLTTNEIAVGRAQQWTQAFRYARTEEDEQSRRFSDARNDVQSRRNTNHTPAWGVGAANADTAPTPTGRAGLGRMARR